MDSKKNVIFWLTFSVFIVGSFVAFPLHPDLELKLSLASLAARAFFGWMAGKLLLLTMKINIGIAI